MDRGLKQVDSLSPVLFIILMERISKNIKGNTVKLGNIVEYSNATSKDKQ